MEVFLMSKSKTKTKNLPFSLIRFDGKKEVRVQKEFSINRFITCLKAIERLVVRYGKYDEGVLGLRKVETMFREGVKNK